MTDANDKPAMPDEAMAKMHAAHLDVATVDELSAALWAKGKTVIVYMADAERHQAWVQGDFLCVAKGLVKTAEMFAAEVRARCGCPLCKTIIRRVMAAAYSAQGAVMAAGDPRRN